MPLISSEARCNPGELALLAGGAFPSLLITRSSRYLAEGLGRVQAMAVVEVKG